MRITDRDGYLSNWAKSPFMVGDCVFNCAEQFLMWRKAEIMDDISTGQQIMATNDPKRKKRLGRQVHFFKQELWESHRDEVMLVGARAKFS